VIVAALPPPFHLRHEPTPTWVWVTPIVLFAATVAIASIWRRYRPPAPASDDRAAADTPAASTTPTPIVTSRVWRTFLLAEFAATALLGLVLALGTRASSGKVWDAFVAGAAVVGGASLLGGAVLAVVVRVRGRRPDPLPSSARIVPPWEFVKSRLRKRKLVPLLFLVAFVLRGRTGLALLSGMALGALVATALLSAYACFGPLRRVETFVEVASRPGVKVFARSRPEV
jgi:hypothetical protein